MSWHAYPIGYSIGNTIKRRGLTHALLIRIALPLPKGMEMEGEYATKCGETRFLMQMKISKVA